MTDKPDANISGGMRELIFAIRNGSAVPTSELLKVLDWALEQTAPVAERGEPVAWQVLWVGHVAACHKLLTTEDEAKSYVAALKLDADNKNIEMKPLCYASLSADADAVRRDVELPASRESLLLAADIFEKPKRDPQSGTLMQTSEINRWAAFALRALASPRPAVGEGK